MPRRAQPVSYERHSPGSSARSLIDRFGFSHLIVSTVLLTAATILLGVAAKGTGAGLACDANWPLCDGGLLNLFPANLPSFFEWIHRVVAMVAGFFIVGTAVAAWRSPSVRSWVTYAITAGMVLTPIQVYLGRETVFVYDLTILNMHFWTAIVIFVLFLVAAVAVIADRLTAKHVTAAFLVGAAVVPAHVVLSPVFVDSYSPVIQTLQYSATLTIAAAAVIVAMIGPRRFEGRSMVALAVVVPIVAFLTTLFGRRVVMHYLPLLDQLYLVVAGTLLLAMLAGTVLSRRLPTRATPTPLG